MKLKYLVAAAALTASSSAFAGATGNVAGVSEYMFRGITQGSGAAVQGGLDYAHDSGIYVGSWASNIDWGVGGYELDVYGGYTHALTDMITLDVGAYYYWYPEEDQIGNDPSVNTIEGYIGLIVGPVTLKYYYSPQYFGAEDASGDDIDESYFLASGAFPLTDSLNLTASVGYTKLSDDFICDGPDGLCTGGATDSYVDYSLGLAKTVSEGLTATFQVIGTDLHDDDPKVVIGLKKVFDL
jgi:uncharacterized protein (TIGR02001 family)